MALADVAYFRAYTAVRADDRRSPLCWIFHPADGMAAYRLTRLMVELPGLCYMRTHRPDVPLLYDEQTTFEPGGFQVLRPGDDLALVASGYMVHEALRAVELLARQGIRAALIDAYSLPIAAERLTEVLQRSGAQALVVEDNYGGGVGAAVAEIAARTARIRVETLCCQRFPSPRAPPTTFSTTAASARARSRITPARCSNGPGVRQAQEARGRTRSEWEMT